MCKKLSLQTTTLAPPSRSRCCRGHTFRSSNRSSHCRLCCAALMARSYYFGVGPLAGGARDMGSSTGRSGRLIGMLSGLWALVPLAGDGGGLTIDAPPGGGACCVDSAPAVPANKPARAAIDAARVKRTGFIPSSSCASVASAIVARAEQRAAARCAGCDAGTTLSSASDSIRPAHYDAP
jgi:hypothetical protein